MSVAAPLVLREGDRPRLEALTAVELDPGRVGAAGADRVAGRRRAAERGDRAADRDLAADGGGLAGPLRRGRGHAPWMISRAAGGRRRSTRSMSWWPRWPTRAARRRDLGVTHWSARLLGAELGISFASVARIWRKWKLQPWRVRDVQVLHRPRAGREDPRRRRAVSGPAGEGRGGLRRREIADPGVGPDRADAADPARGAREADPRLRPQRHHHPVRRAGGGHRQGRARPACPGTATRSSCASSSRSPRPTRA